MIQMQDLNIKYHFQASNSVPHSDKTLIC